MIFFSVTIKRLNHEWMLLIMCSLRMNYLPPFKTLLGGGDEGGANCFMPYGHIYYYWILSENMLLMWEIYLNLCWINFEIFLKCSKSWLFLLLLFFAFLQGKFSFARSTKWGDNLLFWILNICCSSPNVEANSFVHRTQFIKRSQGKHALFINFHIFHPAPSFFEWKKLQI